MNLLAVLISPEIKPIVAGSKKKSGIDKQPVSGACLVTDLGLENDRIGNKKHHGGVDQAVYIYGQLDYDWWAEELGQPLAVGAFGENLLIDGLESGRLMVGDRFQIGDLLLEVSAPRIPCGTLATWMGQSTFVKQFRDAERPGAYCRVLHEGHIKVGMEVVYMPASEETVSLLELYRYFFKPYNDPLLVERMLQAPIAIRMREKLG